MSVASLPAENAVVRWLRGTARQLALPVVGILTGLLVGAIIIVISGFDPVTAYGGLWSGAFGDLGKLNNTLAATTPYIFTTLAVILAFKAGLFNIGAEGQLKIGAITSASVGVAVGDLPFFIAVPLALAAGCLAGALWGALPGALKAFSGAHEVITTIMLNYIATFLTSFLVGASGPLRGNKMSATAQLGPNARIPTIVAYDGSTGTGDTSLPMHYGFFLAILAAILIYWMLEKTPFGFEIRTVGLNPSAARYAGINVKRVLVIVMAGAGLLAGLAGTLEVAGNPNLTYQYRASLGVNYGFNSIAIALLAKNNPLAAIPAAILFAALQNGASQMQFVTQSADGRQLPGDLISIVQALVIIFVAADQVLRWLYRIKLQQGEQVQLSRGWGKVE